MVSRNKKLIKRNQEFISITMSNSSDDDDIANYVGASLVKLNNSRPSNRQISFDDFYDMLTKDSNSNVGDDSAEGGGLDLDADEVRGHLDDTSLPKVPKGVETSEPIDAHEHILDKQEAVKGVVVPIPPPVIGVGPDQVKHTWKSYLAQFRTEHPEVQTLKRAMELAKPLYAEIRLARKRDPPL